MGARASTPISTDLKQGPLRGVAGAWALCFALTTAADDEPKINHGKHFLNADLAAPVTSTQDAQTATPEQFEALVAAVEAGQLQRGPYDAANAESQLDLARYFDAAGDHESAVVAYARALHLLRVNEGLYSDTQRPVVRALLNSTRRSGDLQALDDRYAYLFRLYGAGQPPLTDIRLQAALEHLRWQREAVGLKLDKEPDRRLSALYSLNQDIIERPEFAEVDAEIRLAFLESQLLNATILQAEVKPPVEVVYGSTRSSAHTSVWQGDPLAQQDFARERLLRLRQRAGFEATAQMEAFIDEAGQEVLLRARAQIALADYRQWSGRRRDAEELYSLVYETLEDLNDAQRLQEWFGQPRPLPDAALLWSESDSGALRRVEVRFDVTDRGEVRNAEVLDEDEGEISNTRVRRQLSATRFRPRYTNAGPVMTEDVSETFVFRD